MKKRKIKNSGYSAGGASHSKKSLKTWQPTHFSAVSDIDFNLETLRNRAADLYLNSPVGRAAVVTVLGGVINEGLRVYPRLNHEELGLTIDEAREWERKTKLEFELWAENIECDFYRRNTFRELQRLAFLNQLVDGDCVCLFRRRTSTSQNPYSLRLQLIEAGRISNPQRGGAAVFNNVEILTDHGRIVNGVEVDSSGRMRALWISNKIFGELMTARSETTWQRVKFFGEKSGEQNLCFLANDTRIEQFRGEPLLAPVIEILRNIYRYSDAELTSGIIKSFFSVFFTQLANQTNYGIKDVVEDNSQDVTEYKLGPGTLNLLPLGVDVKAINSGGTSMFDSYTTYFTKLVGAALNLPYEVLLKNFQSSYSASKAALLQAENTFRQHKQSFTTDFLEPVYRQFLSESVALGRIEAPGFFEDALKKNLWCGASWANETNHSLDANKEVAAAKMRLELGLSTYTKEAAELNGTNFEDNVRKLAAERKMLQDLDRNDFGE